MTKGEDIRQFKDMGLTGWAPNTTGVFSLAEGETPSALNGVKTMTMPLTPAKVPLTPAKFYGA